MHITIVLVGKEVFPLAEGVCRVITGSTDDRRPTRAGAEAILQRCRRTGDGTCRESRVPGGMGMGASTLGERPKRLRLLLPVKTLPRSHTDSQSRLLLLLNDGILLMMTMIT